MTLSTWSHGRAPRTRAFLHDHSSISSRELLLLLLSSIFAPGYGVHRWPCLGKGSCVPCSWWRLVLVSRYTACPSEDRKTCFRADPDGTNRSLLERIELFLWYNCSWFLQMSCFKHKTTEEARHTANFSSVLSLTSPSWLLTSFHVLLYWKN